MYCGHQRNDCDESRRISVVQARRNYYRFTYTHNTLHYLTNSHQVYSAFSTDLLSKQLSILTIASMRLVVRDEKLAASEYVAKYIIGKMRTVLEVD
jgi:hypothetical protein